MNVRPVRDEASYEWALREIAACFMDPPAQGTSEADRFDVLATFIGAYEAEVHPVPDAEPLDVLRFCMEQNGRCRGDLANVLGSRARAAKVLAGRRRLTFDMIRRIGRAWHVPASALMSRGVLDRGSAGG